MSDVERICETNHDRRKWAEEYESKHDVSPVELVHSNEKKQKCSKELRMGVLHTGSTACLMAAGGGAAFVGMGASMGDWVTVVVGLVVAAVFILTGTQLEWLRDEIKGGRRDA